MFKGLLLNPRTLGLPGGNRGKRAMRETAVSIGHSKCTELCSEPGPGMGSLVLALALTGHAGLHLIHACWTVNAPFPEEFRFLLDLP